MFQTVAILVFLATIIGIIVHWFAYPTAACRSEGLVRGLIRVLSLLLIEQRSSLLGALKKLCYIVAVVCFVLLGLTGFWPILVRGEHISGWPVIVHATLAPIFAICLAILALTWAGQNRFQQGDCPWLRRLLRRVTRLALTAPDEPCNCAATTLKIAFWAIMVLALPLILSIVLSMLPLYGTHWQEVALAVHGWTALIFAVAVLIHTYMAVRVRLGQ
ncbi:MAG: cytochrome b/b6 domain-containing protein [Planctomycetota bacterium]|jgi:cytochrome b subunit of formate dehydrogenase